MQGRDWSWRALGQMEAQSALLTTLTLLAVLERGEYARALQDGEQGLQLARQVGASERICRLLDQLSWLAIRQGRHEDALKLAHEGLELARRQADEENMARLLNRLAHAMWARGHCASGSVVARRVSPGASPGLSRTPGDVLQQCSAD